MTPNSVTVSTVVATPPDVAFTMFTGEIDAWWRRASRHRSRPAASIVRFEDDRLVEVSDEGSIELGRVLAWEPGSRLVLAWSGPHWAPAERTEVEITFEAENDGTRVTVEHRGWTDVATGSAEAAVIGLWWGDLLAGYKYRASHPERSVQR
jgi:uncharacterized protein YndB with AHSA1/START domain